MNSLIYKFQILKNNSDSCLTAKIIIHFFNFCLWSSIATTAVIAIFLSDTNYKKLIGFLCLMMFFADFILLASIEAPVLHNPFKKKAQVNDDEHKEQGKEEIVKVKEDVNVTEEFNKSVDKASKVKESESLDPSVFN